jgi:hypothetical protein
VHASVSQQSRQYEHTAEMFGVDGSSHGTNADGLAGVGLLSPHTSFGPVQHVSQYASVPGQLLIDKQQSLQ